MIRSGVIHGSLTDRSGTITAGGVSQQLAVANPDRCYLAVQNLGTAALWINFGSAASAGQPSLCLKGGTADNDGLGAVLFFEGDYCPTDAVFVYGATTGKPFTAKEG